MRDRDRSGRVLILVQNLPVPFDRRVWLECQTLVAAGYTVSVICPRGPGDASYEHLDDVHIHRYRPAPPAEGLAGYSLEFAWCWLLTALLSLRVLRRQGFDVIQACNPPDTFWALALAYRVLGKRFVYDQHDLCPEVYASRFGPAASASVLQALSVLEAASYRVADHVVSTNGSYKRMAITRGGRHPDDVTVVRSGPDTSRMFRGEPEPALRNGRKHLACYLGVMGPQDGVDVLVRAWAVLVHDLHRDDCQLALLGFGDCLQGLRQLTRELDLEAFVTFTGRADASVISRYLSTADVGLCPDPHSPLNDASTMNKTMEYMAFGLPVVSFDLPESVVSAGDAALFIEGDDPADLALAVADLFEDVTRREELGSRARERAVSILDWRVQAPAYIRVFDRLCGRAHRELYVQPDLAHRGRFQALPDRRVTDRRHLSGLSSALFPRQRQESRLGERRCVVVGLG